MFEMNKASQIPIKTIRGPRVRFAKQTQENYLATSLISLMDPPYIHPKATKPQQVANAHLVLFASI